MDRFPDLRSLLWLGLQCVISSAEARGLPHMGARKMPCVAEKAPSPPGAFRQETSLVHHLLQPAKTLPGGCFWAATAFCHSDHSYLAHCYLIWWRRSLPWGQNLSVLELHLFSNFPTALGWSPGNILAGEAFLFWNTQSQLQVNFYTALKFLCLGHFSRSQKQLVSFRHPNIPAQVACFPPFTSMKGDSMFTSTDDAFVVFTPFSLPSLWGKGRCWFCLTLKHPTTQIN